MVQQGAGSMKCTHLEKVFTLKKGGRILGFVQFVHWFVHLSILWFCLWNTHPCRKLEEPPRTPFFQEHITIHNTNK